MVFRSQLVLEICDGVLWEEDEKNKSVYLYAPREKEFFMLEGTGYWIWRCLQQRLTLGSTIDKLSKIFKKVDLNTLEKDVFNFLDELEKRGIIRPLE